MCGIVGYIGKQSAAPIIVEGLRRLEYRGYDSAGLSIINGDGLQIRKKKGKIDEGLAKFLQTNPLVGSVGVGHTRWATHGQPSDENSHPHLDESGKIAVVHNGVIENYERLKERQLKAGHKFRSSTDTEVLAHLIGEHYAKLRASHNGAGDGKGNGNGNAAHLLAQAVMEALREVIGTYGVAVVCSEFPEVIV